MSIANSTYVPILKSRYSQGRPVRKLIGLVVMVLLVALWAPALTSVGDGFNLSIFAALLSLGLLVFLNKAYAPPLPQRGDRTVLSLLALCLIFLIVLSMLSAIQAEDLFRTLRPIAASIFGLAILYSITNLPPTGSTLTRLINLLIWSATVSSIFATAAYFYPPLGSIFFGLSDRTAAFFKHPNQFGIALSLIIPVLAAVILAERYRPYRMLQMILIFMGLVFSGSKTNLAISAASVSAVTLIVLYKQGVLRRFPFILPLVITTLAMLLVGGFYALGELNPRAQRLMQNVADGESIQSFDARKRIWAKSIQDGLDNPFLGVGPGQPVFGDRMPHSHNVILEMFRTLGLPGLLITTAMILLVIALSCSTLMQSAKTRHTHPRYSAIAVGLAFGTLNYIAANQFSDSFGPSTQPLFWACVGLLLGIRAMKNSRSTPQRPQKTI